MYYYYCPPARFPFMWIKFFRFLTNSEQFDTTYMVQHKLYLGMRTKMIILVTVLVIRVHGQQDGQILISVPLNWANVFKMPLKWLKVAFIVFPETDFLIFGCQAVYSYLKIKNKNWFDFFKSLNTKNLYLKKNCKCCCL